MSGSVRSMLASSMPMPVDGPGTFQPLLQGVGPFTKEILHRQTKYLNTHTDT